MGRSQLGSLRSLINGQLFTRCSSLYGSLVGVSALTEEALLWQKTKVVQQDYSDELSSRTDDLNSYQYPLSNSRIFGKVPSNFLKCYPTPSIYISFQNTSNFHMRGWVDQSRKLKGFSEMRHLSATMQSLEQSRIDTYNVYSSSVMQKVQGDIEAGHFAGAESAHLSGAKENFGSEKENIKKRVKQAESKHILSATQSPAQFRDPAGLYQELLRETRFVKRTSQELQHLADIFMQFSKRGWAGDQALALYINASFFPIAVSKFKTFFTNRCSQGVLEFLMRSVPSKETDCFLFPIFAEFCMGEFAHEIARFRTLVQFADLTKPHKWFPFARAMRRRIIYHCGPTNSGKTYRALQKFMEAKSGIYCSPLRLLAMEVFDNVNACGVCCSLHTGQEKKELAFANHVACTIEMASADNHYEVAVIDEIQMIGDEFRGVAWSRSLLGLKADEIHICGDPSVLSLVRDICAVTGDNLTEKHYERFKPLVVEAKSLQGNFQNFQPGDCVVAFSRREIFEVKLAIERFTNHRCCVVYGALPPETRKQQANLFNDPDNEYDVLVASDAVGMGLNLNIRRVVFYGVKKYNGDKTQHVPASQVKQIAGRAGRRGSQYPGGLTTAFLTEDLQYLTECLQQPFEVTKHAGLFPCFEQIEIFASQFSDISFSQLLDKFSENCRLDVSYFLCRHDHIKKVAQMLDKVLGLSLQDRYNFCFAPVNTSDVRAMEALLKFAIAYSKNQPVRLVMGVPRGSARNDLELLDLETRHQVLSMYLWLSQHFREETFPSKETAEHMATNIANLLGQSLANVCWKPEPRLRETRVPGRDAAVARPT